MAGFVESHGGYALGSRIPTMKRDMIQESTKSVRDHATASRVVMRDEITLGAAPASTCEPTDTSGPCAKPVTINSMTLTIVLGTVIPFVAAVAVLLYLHRRHMKKLKKEDAADPHKSLDFGMEERGPRAKGGKRKSFMTKEKGMPMRTRQMSMDLDISSPYLLPPGLQGSVESLHSLARSLHQNEDPYRPVAQYAGGDATSVRSARRKEEDSSMHSDSTKGYEAGYNSDRKVHSGTFAASPGKMSSPTSPGKPKPTLRKPEPPLSAASTIVSTSPPQHKPFLTPSNSADFTKSPPPYPVDNTPMASAPAVRAPLPTAQRGMHTAPPTNQQGPDGGYAFNFDNTHYQEDLHNLPNSPHRDQQNNFAAIQTHVNPSSPQQQSPLPRSAPLVAELHQNQGPAQHPGTLPTVEEPEDYYDEYEYAEQMGHEQYGYQAQQDYEGRGRDMHRQTMNYQQDAYRNELAVPQQDSRRLSVGFRPLPPGEFMDTEDPETRANRIRSFYKEYFDETRGAPLPTAHYRGTGNYPQSHGGAKNHQDYYDDNNLGNYYPNDAAYYDPDANAFVMPYAQPVARRAMTPPPSGSRFQSGPRGAPRGYHGSVGHMSSSGLPRPDSSASNQRPGSYGSSAWGRSRAGSTMSGGRPMQPRKPMPPPPALSTLPTPSKLRDDSFALFNAADFAPPETFKDRVRGRSQSPSGERRPYHVNVPAHSPLANAFDELASLPSPSNLRKSGTFTGLDFAAPRKFGNADSRSETGSIRSNRSGISTKQLSAIRGGAGRVSRLPGDTIFAQAQSQQKLKPSWTMRD